MPHVTRPRDTPEEVEVVHESLGNRARSRLVHELSAQGAMETSELADALELRVPAVQRHLNILEVAEVVSADLPRGERVGRSVRWRVNSERLDDLTGQWVRYLHGDL